MHPQWLFALHIFLLVFLVPLSFSEDSRYDDCAPISCGDKLIKYPFGVENRPGYCSHPYFPLSCEEDDLALKLEEGSYSLLDIDYENHHLTIVNKDFQNNLCPQPLHNISLPPLSPYSFTSEIGHLPFYSCSQLVLDPIFHQISCFPNTTNLGFFILTETISELPFLRTCEAPVVVPVLATVLMGLIANSSKFGEAVRRGFSLVWREDLCSSCEQSRGRCGYDSGFICFFSPGNSKTVSKFVIGVSVSASVGILLLAIIAGFIIFYIRRRNEKRNFLNRSIPDDDSTKPDYENGSTTQFLTSIPAVSLFTYKELEQATNSFNPSNELGDGGFGTVYYGKLRDGRSVAVKRLYESNYRRVEQFMNEVKILSGLRHQNLVCLYGCTSRHSRELLLVYEYIPNGTVADHLHGELPNAFLDWPTRLKIAVETAEALAFLHAVEPPIIHRDVKTNNILLDNSFRVKVADFGLSRLFPMDVTHVSTAPQGTPGYVDPDYHKCYQLTGKSDVYSFGVVLVELISSKPAVDITRDRDEINLANLAIRKIINKSLDELIDPSLGFESDSKVRRMVTDVADLAFRCLAAEKEERPSMEAVLAVLKRIEKDGFEGKIPREQVDILADDVGLLTSLPPVSPDSVTDKWTSNPTTSDSSNEV